MADYWMKLYTEILDDPKMAILPDRLWRRIIELFMVAKRTNKDGHLPDTKQIAWLLRMSPDDLERDMIEIEKTGIITKDQTGWFVPNFAKRQQAVTGAERQQKSRAKRQQDEYYGDGDDNVTGASRNVPQSRAKQRQRQSRAKQNARASSLPPVNSNSPDPVAEKAWQSITDQLMIPTPFYQDALPTLQMFIAQKKGVDGAVEYLKPYFEAYRKRYPTGNHEFWLTEWAVSGVIPNADKNNPSKSRTVTKIDPYGNEIQVPV